MDNWQECLTTWQERSLFDRFVGQRREINIGVTKFIHHNAVFDLDTTIRHDLGYELDTDADDDKIALAA